MKARPIWVLATSLLAVGLLVPSANSLSRGSDSGKTTPIKEVKVDVPAEMRYPHEPIFQQYFDEFLGSSKSALENIDNLREGPFGVSRIPVTRIGSHTLQTFGNLGVLYGNGTDAFKPSSWTPKAFGYGSRGPEGEAEKKSLKSFAKEAAPYFESGFRGALRWRTDIGVIEARPVVITKSDCQRCHTESKPGDVGGIVMARLSPDDMATFRKANSENP
jgi:hypothetical protein